MIRKFFAVLLFVFSFHNAQAEQVLVEANDAGEAVYLSAEEYAEFTGEKFMAHLVSYFNFKMSWETVTSYISPQVEQEYDVFIMVNVDFQGRFNSGHEIPSQHMKVIQRTQAGQKLFVRKGGRIVAIQPNVAGNNGVPAFRDGVRASGRGVLKDLMPISSGAGHFAADPQPYVDTPTGIYRINHSKSDVKRYGTGMWHSLYFDLLYPWNKWSGLAVHGTSNSKYRKLGTQQSHGCVRTTKAQANVMYENLVNDDYWWSDSLPDLNNRKRLKGHNGSYSSGVRALIVIFYGYDRALEVYDI